MRTHVWYAMQVFRNHALLRHMDQLGVPRPDLETLSGPDVMLAGDRYRVRRAMDAILYGALDALGIQRFELSAEYIAGFIALVVHPTNHMVVCAWYHGAQTADSILAEPDHVPVSEGVTAHALLELVVQAVGERDLGSGKFQQMLHDTIVANAVEIDAASDGQRPKD